MYDREEDGFIPRFESLWRQPTSFDTHALARNAWLFSLRTDARLRVRNEEETRRFLAQEVYRVPAEWLDDVLRVRMAETRC
jgi:hypothetical protein